MSSSRGPGVLELAFIPLISAKSPPGRLEAANSFTTPAQSARTIQQLRTEEMTDQVAPAEAADTPARRQTRKRPPSVGPYSKPAALAKVDGAWSPSPRRCSRRGRIYDSMFCMVAV